MVKAETEAHVGTKKETKWRSLRPNATDETWIFTSLRSIIQRLATWFCKTRAAVGVSPIGQPTMHLCSSKTEFRRTNRKFIWWTLRGKNWNKSTLLKSKSLILTWLLPTTDAAFICCLMKIRSSKPCVFGTWTPANSRNSSNSIGTSKASTCRTTARRLRFGSTKGDFTRLIFLIQRVWNTDPSVFHAELSAECVGTKTTRASRSAFRRRPRRTTCTFTTPKRINPSVGRIRKRADWTLRTSWIVNLSSFRPSIKTTERANRAWFLRFCICRKAERKGNCPSWSRFTAVQKGNIFQISRRVGNIGRTNWALLSLCRTCAVRRVMAKHIWN